MRITAVKTWLVEGIEYNWTLLKVYADSGLTGIGEATNWPGSPLVLAAREHQVGPVMSAIGAADIALWDLAGKRAGMPVYELLRGAYRKPIALYANYWFLDGDGSPASYACQNRGHGQTRTIASSHVMAAIPDFFLQEFMMNDVPWRDTILSKPLPVSSGSFQLCDEPGLGFDLVEDELLRHPGVRTSRAGFYV
jgi:L-alanine-DL-glutamate epimerase-like enolase superfamily enzyme